MSFSSTTTVALPNQECRRRKRVCESVKVHPVSKMWTLAKKPFAGLTLILSHGQSVQARAARTLAASSRLPVEWLRANVVRASDRMVYGLFGTGQERAITNRLQTGLAQAVSEAKNS